MAQSEKIKTLTSTTLTQSTRLQVLIQPPAQILQNKHGHAASVALAGGPASTYTYPPPETTCAVKSRENAMDREVHRTVL